MSPRIELVLNADELRAGPRSVLAAEAPSVIPTYLRFRESMKESVIDPALRERVRLRNATIVGCKY